MLGDHRVLGEFPFRSPDTWAEVLVALLDDLVVEEAAPSPGDQFFHMEKDTHDEILEAFDAASALCVEAIVNAG